MPTPTARQTSLALAQMNALVGHYTDLLNEALKPTGLTAAGLNLLHHIQEDKVLNQTAIAREMWVTPASISKQIKTFLDLDWVDSQANPANRRENLLTLTPLGQTKYQEAARIGEDLLTRYGTALSSAEWQAFQDTLTKLRTITVPKHEQPNPNQEST